MGGRARRSEEFEDGGEQDGRPCANSARDTSGSRPTSKTAWKGSPEASEEANRQLPMGGEIGWVVRFAIVLPEGGDLPHGEIVAKRDGGSVYRHFISHIPGIDCPC